MKKRCILIRHAKTKGNDEKRYIGANTDEELSKSGIEQAERRKDDILKLVTKNTQVFSSPMKRALQTARLLFEDMSITVIKDLKETDFGLFEGKTYDDLKDDSDYQLFLDSKGRSGFPKGEKTEDFINRFRYKPTKSNQVQSRIKQLEKLDRLEIDETDNVRLTVKFPPAPRSGDIVFKASGITVGYPGKVVFRDADIEVKRGEKVALIGRNGEGKTTLMRVITGELTPLEGEAKRGYNVAMGYYAQNQEDILDRNLTVWETLDNIAVGDIRTKLRDILAQFLFRGEDIDKKVSVLSGGERARLGMAKFMLQPYNLLALDEPTNHMDIKSKEILKEALKAYDGTLIVVSHDRDFLDGLVDKMYEFRDGKVKEHLGGVTEFLENRKIESLQELERRFGKEILRDAQDDKTIQGNKKILDNKKEEAREAFERKRTESKEIRRVRHRIDFLEGEIGKLEKKMKDIEKILSNPTADDDIMELTRTYLEDKRELDHKTSEWESLMEKLEE